MEPNNHHEVFVFGLSNQKNYCTETLIAVSEGFSFSLLSLLRVKLFLVFRVYLHTAEVI